MSHMRLLEGIAGSTVATHVRCPTSSKELSMAKTRLTLCRRLVRCCNAACSCLVSRCLAQRCTWPSCDIHVPKAQNAMQAMCLNTGACGLPGKGSYVDINHRNDFQSIPDEMFQSNLIFFAVRLIPTQSTQRDITNNRSHRQNNTQFVYTGDDSLYSRLRSPNRIHAHPPPSWTSQLGLSQTLSVIVVVVLPV